MAENKIGRPQAVGRPQKVGATDPAQVEPERIAVPEESHVAQSAIEPQTTVQVAEPPPPPPPVREPVTKDSDFRKLGDIPKSVWRRVLESANSPLLAELDAIYGIVEGQSLLALAQAYKESSLGKAENAKARKNPLGLMEGDGRTLRAYPSWAAAFADYMARITDPNYKSSVYPDGCTLEQQTVTYVGGPLCWSTRGKNCANGETWDGGSGGSIGQYIRQSVERVQQWAAMAEEAAPEPSGSTPPAPEECWTEADHPLDMIADGEPHNRDYGFLADYGLPYYQYIIGHGGDRATQHPGIDISMPYGKPIYSPGAGVVVCVGHDGTPLWGQGCGYYNDFGDGASGATYGVGNLSILFDPTPETPAMKAVFGHAREVFVKVGERVEPGQKIATTGGMNGAHIHYEIAQERNGSYWMVEPVEWTRKLIKHYRPRKRRGAGKAGHFNPFPKPEIHDLVQDCERYGITKAQAQKIRGNCFPSRPHGIKMIVLHTQAGITVGSLNWWATGPGVQASSSIITNKDGTLLRVVPDDHGPWTNGDVRGTNARRDAFMSKYPGVNLNQLSVTIEAEGNPDDDMPEAQIAANCWMVYEWMRRHGLGVEDIWFHSEINVTERQHCPGKYGPIVVQRIKDAIAEHGAPGTK